ncbi:MAG: polyprenyl synthetase family protein [Gammaproteobacteria bacterium]|nr:polyprenyl synthetase family protein [Gammaproteobacteria bacterium]MBT5204942.1 polyprenyl synthetase family protein [Gammaproteobacteria bacterium]MBT6247108.1 polyprenyl synthetase family protein [Gammaproteobacteria bacterium]
MNEFLKLYQQRIQEALTANLDKPGTPANLQEAIGYAVLGGGKRLRAAFVYLTCEALEVDLSLADSSAIAVELLHAYSLIHDDLPAMDNDLLRRGLPTVHVKYGQALAILAGDALQAGAFQSIADDEMLSTAHRIQLIHALAVAAGQQGMVAGQVLDMHHETVAATEEQLITMHRGKTGALIEFCMLPACIIAKADNETTEQLRYFGEIMGLAFQIRDDILDETGDSAILGKQAGADRHRGKSTFVSILGLSSAQTKLEQLTTEALKTIERLGSRGQGLRQLAHYVAGREY